MNKEPKLLANGELRMAEHLGGPDFRQKQIKLGIRSGDSGKSPGAESRMPDLVCFSHLRWDFVYQRPQHLLTRCALDRRVFFVEEPIFGNGSMRLDVRERDGDL